MTKTCVAVPHTDVDEHLLAAGMSLPVVMPPLRRGNRVWTDAVWVKDANVTEALRRGADEVWLVWCIGNSPYWGDGPLEQYVHMIEMSANGALFAELDAARRPVGVSPCTWCARSTRCRWTPSSTPGGSAPTR